MIAAAQHLHGITDLGEFRKEIAKEIRARSTDAVAMNALADELDNAQVDRENEMRAKQQENHAGQSAELGAANQKAWNGGAKVMTSDLKSEVDQEENIPGVGEQPDNTDLLPAGGISGEETPPEPTSRVEKAEHEEVTKK